MTYFPLFQGLTHYVNPALEAFPAKTPITVAANDADCKFHIFVGPWSKFSDCDRAKDFLTKQGLSFKSVPAGRRQGRGPRSAPTRSKGWDRSRSCTRRLQGGGLPGDGRQDRRSTGS